MIMVKLPLLPFRLLFGQHPTIWIEIGGGQPSGSSGWVGPVLLLRLPVVARPHFDSYRNLGARP
jgi:hypothetical protein